MQGAALGAAENSVCAEWRPILIPTHKTLCQYSFGLDCTCGYSEGGGSSGLSSDQRSALYGEYRADLHWTSSNLNESTVNGVGASVLVHNVLLVVASLSDAALQVVSLIEFAALCVGAVVTSRCRNLSCKVYRRLSLSQ